MIQGQGQPLRSPKGQNFEKTANFIEKNCQNRLFFTNFQKNIYDQPFLFDFFLENIVMIYN